MVLVWRLNFNSFSLYSDLSCKLFLEDSLGDLDSQNENMMRGIRSFSKCHVVKAAAAFCTAVDVRGTEKTALECLGNDRRLIFTPTSSSRPPFQRKEDEAIWRRQADVSLGKTDLITYLKKAPWSGIVTPDIRESIDCHMGGTWIAANYLVGWSGILRHLLPQFCGYTLQWEILKRQGMGLFFDHLTVSKKDRIGKQRVVLVLVAHALIEDYGEEDFKTYTDFKMSFMRGAIGERVELLAAAGRTGHRVHWIGAFGWQFVVGVKNETGDVMQTTKNWYDVFQASSKGVLLKLVKSIDELIL
ncbi:uncharacterized protein LOC129587743 [Paramacrobiotus metropolitanus]|uniref:uncharacterized protein LOC129587743 n=1 Tax=Paramacrobiotus metropolitanus TaxID=2943436 RepID=UPI0024457797|nr:uncharacterized protein LOC129587743 [Paramacrobiotus metropolitanus]XP_055337602.1 uncharacterized protein LOC129587743 [Paramacrobiotus metropolitanus]XP_055337603.1 uncharacterized protein LOC129587743 [Paramacrobiotus metropolitanus]XP_055337604.1 uncharacterized protein LOC129587743 [Paramacrobiotus metropolitanus]XP_055337605.1 uncharacterized protein LOC129587743 [Paramacrobiotus metropolitanus]XP_055337606.1 uncharacterized protein LOC129587743 [Paramacrobiotus metropolitanus]